MLVVMAPAKIALVMIVVTKRSRQEEKTRRADMLRRQSDSSLPGRNQSRRAWQQPDHQQILRTFIAMPAEPSQLTKHANHSMTVYTADCSRDDWNIMLKIAGAAQSSLLPVGVQIPCFAIVGLAVEAVSSNHGVGSCGATGTLHKLAGASASMTGLVYLGAGPSRAIDQAQIASKRLRSICLAAVTW